MAKTPEGDQSEGGWTDVFEYSYSQTRRVRGIFYSLDWHRVLDVRKAQSSSAVAVTILAGVHIGGDVEFDGAVDFGGRLEGNLRCAAVAVLRPASIVGSIVAERVVVDGRVDGPIFAKDVVLKSKAHVLGDIEAQSLDVEEGAWWQGDLIGTGTGVPRVVRWAESLEAGSSNEASWGLPSEEFTRMAELAVEARHQLRDVGLSYDAAVELLAESGDPDAIAILKGPKTCLRTGKQSPTESNNLFVKHK